MKKLLIPIFILLTTLSYSQEIVITTQPVSLVECNDKAANLFINAETKTNTKLIYQWYKDDEKLLGEVFPVLKFPSFKHNQSGSYFCRVYDEDKTDSVDSRSASVYVIRPTSISKQPEDAFTSINSDIITLNFEAHINGFGINEAMQKGEFVNIQWFRRIENTNTKLINSDIYNGANSSKLSINTLKLPDTTYYFAEIEGLCGIATTRIVKVIKNLNLLEIAITGLDACEGNFESLKSQIINPKNHILEFKWYKDGKPIYYKESIDGIYSDELKFNPIFMNDAGKYKLEAKIKDINYSVLSNEVDVKVGKKPKIVCVRVDTLYAKDENYYGYKNYLNSWLNIFYEKNNLSIQFDIYRNGKLIDTKFSDSSVFWLGDIYYQDYIYERDDSAIFWVIAHNKCGYDYSDTVIINNQIFCDPFNQFHEICNDDSFAVYTNYKEKEPVNQLSYIWVLHQHGGFIIYVPMQNNYAKATKNELEMHSPEFVLNTENKDVTAKYNLRYEVYRTISETKTSWEDEFCCYYIKVNFIPKLLRQPVNKIFNYGETDTLFYIYFDNEFGKEIEVELYYMASLNHKPRLVDKSVPTWAKWYNYIKNITYAEDGYYYALARYNNYCDPMITDTIRVTVAPKGTTSISDFESNSNLMITPNPAGDYITISIPELNKGLQPLVQSVRIFNTLGIEVSSAGRGLSEVDGGGCRINISNLPTGVYFIKIGDRVEKFVKM